MPYWLGMLIGDEDYLAAVAEHLVSQALVVERVEHGYTCRAPKLDASTEASEVREALHVRINALIALQASQWGRPSAPVKVARLLRVHEDGRVDATVFLEPAAVIAFGGSASLAVGSPGSPAAVVADPLDDRIEVAAQSTNVADAVAILAEADDFFALYKVLEIIKDDVGGRDKIVSAGFADSGSIDRFKMSANHQSVSGKAARHARMSGTPPSKGGMSLNQARAWMRGVVDAWIDSKRTP